jgi:hypothetical protein
MRGLVAVLAIAVAAGGCHRLVEDGDVSRDLLVGRDGPAFAMDEPGAVRADPGGASLSYVACADDCRAAAIATYRDPLIDPVRWRVALPADACPAPMVSADAQGGAAGRRRLVIAVASRWPVLDAPGAVP